MEGESPSVAEPVFRASKRRKVYRKKTSLDGTAPPEDQQAQDEPPAQFPTSGGGDGYGDETAIAARTLRKSRKHGMNFSSSTTIAPRESEEAIEETSLVLAQTQVPEPADQQNDRFVRPTGKAVVMDDRHMLAFVDSKMAELRSATTASTEDTSISRSHILSQAPEENPSHNGYPTAPKLASTDESAQSAKPTATTAKSQSTRPTRPRRQPVRTEADIARDGLIDQIMKESPVPVYDQAATPSSQLPSGAAGDIDNDAAAAAAFRAEFLAAAEQRNLQRRPPAPPAAGTTHGPKLGGSRAQRERMKAVEEAKARGK